MRWVCILFPQLALDAVLRQRPEPDEPLVLLSGPAQRRVLQAVNGAARKLGLRPGQSMTAAQALSKGFATADERAGIETLTFGEDVMDNRAAERLDQLRQFFEVFFSDRARQIGEHQTCGDDFLDH